MASITPAHADGYAQASYFLMISSALAAYRVAAFIFEENFGHSALPIFRTRRERATACTCCCPHDQSETHDRHSCLRRLR
jgi:hypothetical protein